jgi:hypothetical protein
MGMSGDRLGMDPEELRALAQGMARAGDELEQVRSLIGVRLIMTPWNGADADTFRADWQYIYALQLANAASMLRDAAGALLRQIDQQYGASRAEPSTRDVAVGGAVAAAVTSVLTLAGMSRTIMRGSAAVSGLLLVNDVLNGARNGWTNKDVGKVTLGIVSKGLTTAGTKLLLGAKAAVTTKAIGAVAVGTKAAGGAAAGGKLIKLGAALSATGVGAKVGVPLILVGIGVSALSASPAAQERVGTLVRGTGAKLQSGWNATTSFISGAVDGFTSSLRPSGVSLSLSRLSPFH